MKAAAIYARYSSHKQREESIEEQVDECREYALQNDMNVVEVYSDSAISGKTENRDGWQRMMSDASEIFHQKFYCLSFSNCPLKYST